MAYGNNCSSGLEPIFSLEYDRKVKIGGQDDKNIQIVKFRDYGYDKWLNTPNRVVKKDVFVTAMELPVDAHVKVLCATSKFVNMAISKTINIPEDYSFEDTKKVYDYCFENGAKGCTIFRPNEIRQGILINKKEVKEEKQHNEITINDLPRGTILEADNNVVGKKRKLMTGCGSLHVVAMFHPDTGDLTECYLSKRKYWTVVKNSWCGLSRLISLSARAGVNVYDIVDQLGSSGVCASYATRKATKKDTSKGSSCPVAIGNALMDMCKEMMSEIEEDEYYEYEDIIEERKERKEIINHKYKCPECDSMSIIMEGGCSICKDCRIF